MSKKPRIQINYKSGNSMVVECGEFTVKHKPGQGITQIGYKDVLPNPMFMGIDDIESVWELS